MRSVLALPLVLAFLAMSTGCAGFMDAFRPAPPPAEDVQPGLPVETSVQIHEELLLAFMDRHPPAHTVLGPVTADGDLSEIVVGRLRSLGYGVAEDESAIPFHITVRRVNGGGHVAAIVQGGTWTLTRSYAISESGATSLISSTMTGADE